MRGLRGEGSNLQASGIQSHITTVARDGQIWLELLFRERFGYPGGPFGQQLAPVVVQKVVQTRPSRRDQSEAHEACDVASAA